MYKRQEFHYNIDVFQHNIIWYVVNREHRIDCLVGLLMGFVVMGLVVGEIVRVDGTVLLVELVGWWDWVFGGIFRCVIGCCD